MLPPIAVMTSATHISIAAHHASSLYATRATATSPSPILSILFSVQARRSALCFVSFFLALARTAKSPLLSYGVFGEIASLMLSAQPLPASPQPVDTPLVISSAPWCRDSPSDNSSRAKDDSTTSSSHWIENRLHRSLLEGLDPHLYTLDAFSAYPSTSC